MNIAISRKCPYAPPSNISHLIQLYREGKLSNHLTSKELTRLGIAEGNLSRIFHTKRFFGFIDEHGHLTERFIGLVFAPKDEYRFHLSTIIREAYSDILTQIPDLSTVTDEQLMSIFRQYAPMTQHRRMLVLFKDLCYQAGLMNSPSSKVRRHQWEFSLLLKLLKQLPASSSWTQIQRDKWLQAFTANLDLLIDIEGE